MFKGKVFNFYSNLKKSKIKSKEDIKCSEENINDDSKIIQINADNDFDAKNKVIGIVNLLIAESPGINLEKDILILNRSSRTLGLIGKSIEDEKFNIPIKTIHWSKGTEFDYVFVLGLKGGLYGFPNVYSDKDIKKVVLDISVDEKEEGKEDYSMLP